MDELKHLLGQLGLGAASDSIYDMIMDLDGEALSMPQLQEAIRRILTLHGYEACADAVIAALGEVSFLGLHSHTVYDGKDKAAGA